MKKLVILLTLFGCLAISAAAQTGRISGNLTYPSDYIPPEMILCVTRNKQNYCSNESAARLSKARIRFNLNHRRASYEVRLPAGTYYIYGAFPKGKAPTSDMENLKAYYNDFVKCGMNIKCTSKKPIAIKVAPGQTVRNITIGDWY
jgi:hypothetical protein